MCSHQDQNMRAFGFREHQTSDHKSFYTECDAANILDRVPKPIHLFTYKLIAWWKMQTLGVIKGHR
jgi:hypothetical protein